MEFYPELVAGYTRIVTITTDNIFTVNDFRASVGAQWTFLSDAGRKVQKDLDIQEYTDPHDDPMIPHTLVLKPGFIIPPCLQRLLVLGSAIDGAASS